MKMLLATVAMTAIATHAGAEVAPKYQVEQVPLSTGFDQVVGGNINDRGQIAFDTVQGQDIFTFFLSNDIRTQISSGGGSVQGLVGMNNQGQVLIDAEIADEDFIQTYLYNHRTGRTINITPGASDEPLSGNGAGGGINQAGHVVGVFDRKVYFYNGTESRYMDIGIGEYESVSTRAINDANTFIGQVTYSGGITRFFKHETGTTEFIEGFSAIYDINNAGQILGRGLDNSSILIRDSDGSFIDLGFDAASGASYDMNDRGWVSAWGLVDGINHAFVYRNGTVYDLNNLLSPDAARQWILNIGSDINESGQIVGVGLFNNEQSLFVATPVPEQGTYALMLCGLGAVGWATRQKRCRQSRS